MFYLKIRDSHTLIIQLQHPPIGLPQSYTDFGGVIKASFLYQVFSEGKIYFTPGVATRLAVVSFSMCVPLSVCLSVCSFFKPTLLLLYMYDSHIFSFIFYSCSCHKTILFQCFIYVNLLKRVPRKIGFTNWVTLLKKEFTYLLTAIFRD